MAWYDAQLPGWLTPQSQATVEMTRSANTRADAEAQNQAWMDRSKEARTAQAFPLEQMIKQAQLDHTKTVIEGGLLDIKGKMLEQSAEVEKKTGLSALAEASQKITAGDGWTDPRSEAEIQALGVKYPWLQREPAWARTLANFPAARKAETDLLKAQNQGQATADRLNIAMMGLEIKGQQLDNAMSNANLNREQKDKMAGEKQALEVQKMDLQREIKFAELQQRAQEKASQRLEDMQFRRYMTALTTLKDKASYAEDPLAAFEKEIDALDARFGIKPEAPTGPIGPPMPVRNVNPSPASASPLTPVLIWNRSNQTFTPKP